MRHSKLLNDEGNIKMLIGSMFNLLPKGKVVLTVSSDSRRNVE